MKEKITELLNSTSLDDKKLGVILLSSQGLDNIKHLFKEKPALIGPKIEFENAVDNRDFCYFQFPEFKIFLLQSAIFLVTQINLGSNYLSIKKYDYENISMDTSTGNTSGTV